MFRYEQRTGRLLHIRSDGPSIIALGYAGAPPCLNDPAKDHLRACGPLPKGRYRIVEAYHPRFASPAFRLQPCAETGMHGRTGFWIHGDNRARNRSASSGCIVIDRPARVRLLRELNAVGAKRVLDVVA